MKHILATVDVASDLPLHDMAQKLSRVIGGVTFEREETGKFEEVPAYVASDVESGMRFILYGIPEGETCDAYILECSAETTLAIAEFGEQSSGFMRTILVEKCMNARGYLDYSNELAVALIDKGIRVKT